MRDNDKAWWADMVRMRKKLMVKIEIDMNLNVERPDKSKRSVEND